MVRKRSDYHSIGIPITLVTLNMNDGSSHDTSISLLPTLTVRPLFSKWYTVSLTVSSTVPGPVVPIHLLRSDLWLSLLYFLHSVLSLITDSDLPSQLSLSYYSVHLSLTSGSGPDLSFRNVLLALLWLPRRRTFTQLVYSSKHWRTIRSGPE